MTRFSFNQWIAGGLVSAGLVAAGAANAAGSGRLLFVNPTTGEMVGGGLDRQGYFQQAFDINLPAEKGRDTVIPTSAGFIVYSWQNGGGQAYLMDASGSIKPAAFSGFSPKWTNILGFGPYALFYNLNGNTADGAVVGVNRDGTLTQTYTATNFSPWTTIGATDNYLFFYNKPNGLYTIASIDVNGALSQYTAAASRHTGYTNFASVGDDVLLWSAATGRWESGAVTYAHLPAQDAYVVAAVSQPTSTSLSGYNLSVASNGRLLLYNSTTGAAMTAHFKQSLQGTPGTFVPDKTFTLPKYFTFLARCGQFLAFYGLGVGQVQFGYIDAGGQYWETQDFHLGAGYTMAASRD